MWPAKYINSVMTGKKTEKQIISSTSAFTLFHTVVPKPFSLCLLFSIYTPSLIPLFPLIMSTSFFFSLSLSCYRHALREYNIHKTLDHLVSGSLNYLNDYQY